SSVPGAPTGSLGPQRSADRARTGAPGRPERNGRHRRVTAPYGPAPPDGTFGLVLTGGEPLRSRPMADFLLGGQLDPASRERTGDLTKVGSGDLTTHGVIVGMTGSGKTGLGVVLIEEALRAGVPTLLIDPKGDLTNLCLTFPDLAPADFEPWVSGSDA